MNVFKIWRDYRAFGLSYGVPAFHVEFGPGSSYTYDTLIKELISKGLYQGALVVLKGSPLREKGAGVLVEALKSMKMKLELEEESIYKDPLWFPNVDRWIVTWEPIHLFNYGALRPRQDMLVYWGTDIKRFLEETQKMICLKALMVGSKREIWDLVKDSDVRVYEKGKSEDP